MLSPQADARVGGKPLSNVTGMYVPYGAWLPAELYNPAYIAVSDRRIGNNWVIRPLPTSEPNG